MKPLDKVKSVQGVLCDYKIRVESTATIIDPKVV
jgi:hypothetical protein